MEVMEQVCEITAEVVLVVIGHLLHLGQAGLPASNQSWMHMAWKVWPQHGILNCSALTSSSCKSWLQMRHTGRRALLLLLPPALLILSVIHSMTCWNDNFPLLAFLASRMASTTSASAMSGKTSLTLVITLFKGSVSAEEDEPGSLAWTANDKGSWAGFGSGWCLPAWDIKQLFC